MERIHAKIMFALQSFESLTLLRMFSSTVISKGFCLYVEERKHLIYRGNLFNPLTINAPLMAQKVKPFH